MSHLNLPERIHKDHNIVVLYEYKGIEVVVERKYLEMQWHYQKAVVEWPDRSHIDPRNAYKPHFHVNLPEE